MKRRIVSLAAVLLLAISVTFPVQAAESRAMQPILSLTFSGTTANCSATVRGGNSSNSISVKMELWTGNTRVKNWSADGTGTVSISKTCPVVKGKTYKLIVNATVAGEALPEIYTTGTC